MGYSGVPIREIVRNAVEHKWSIPEFQRGFVWKTTQVRDLIESLWLDYPVGTLLVWNSAGPVETRSATDAQNPDLWVVDGQQRTTAFCLVTGRKPYWWSSASDWEKTIRKYDIRFDIHAKDPPYFVIANAATRKVKGLRYIPLREILTLDTNREEDLQKLQAIAKQVKKDGFCESMDAMEIFTRLERLRKIRDMEVVIITVDNELEDVVEIFSRLNSKMTRVTEADIYLGVVAARAPKWVREDFLPFVSELDEAGHDVNPNLVFRTLTGVGKKRIRFKYIEDSFWYADSIQPAWARTTRAWRRVVKNLKDFGISGNALLPTDNALVPLTALVDKFPDEPFGQQFYWFLQASRFGRYSGSSTTSLEEDLRHVEEARDLRSALESLLLRLRYAPPVTPDDFLRDYGDSRFGRLMLYLLVVTNQAIDWDKQGLRIGFDSTELLAGFQPQFHHIFPKAFLKDQVDKVHIDALANIAIIGPTINIRISKQNPMSYIDKYGITDEKLRQQFISPAIRQTEVTQYVEWLNARAETLAKKASIYLEFLRGGLALPAVVSEAAKEEEHAYDAA